MTSNEKDERMKRLHTELRLKRRQLQTLEKRVQLFHDMESVTLDDDSDGDMRTLMREYASTVASHHDEESFQYLFWKQQMDNALKADTQSIWWHPLIIKWCLYLHHRYG